MLRDFKPNYSKLKGFACTSTGGAKIEVNTDTSGHISLHMSANGTSVVASWSKQDIIDFANIILNIAESGL